MDRQRLTYLLSQYSLDQATANEVQELSRYIDSNNDSEVFGDVVAELIDKNTYVASPTELAAFADVARKASRN